VTSARERYAPCSLSFLFFSRLDVSSVGFQEEVEKFAWEKIKRWKYSEPEKTFSFQYCFSSVKEKWIICDTIQVGTFCRSQNLFFFFERSHLLIII